jgi:hypothetical protein
VYNSVLGTPLTATNTISTVTYTATAPTIINTILVSNVVITLLNYNIVVNGLILYSFTSTGKGTNQTDLGITLNTSDSITITTNVTNPGQSAQFTLIGNNSSLSYKIITYGQGSGSANYPLIYTAPAATVITSILSTYFGSLTDLTYSIQVNTSLIVLPTNIFQKLELNLILNTSDTLTLTATNNGNINTNYVIFYVFGYTL